MIQIFSRIFHKLAFVAPGGYSVRPWLQRHRGVAIGHNVWISQYVYMDEIHPEAIQIDENCTIGLRTSIITHLYWGPRRKHSGFKKVVIEKNSFVGPHCLLLPGSRVGEGSVIKGGSVVTQHVPPHTFWGPPASGPLALVTVPLVTGCSYQEFLTGLKPLPKRSVKGD